MKKILCISLTIFMLLSVCSCTSQSYVDIEESTKPSSDTGENENAPTISESTEIESEIENKEPANAADIYKWLGENDPTMDYVVSDKSISFINDHLAFFPSNGNNTGEISDYVNFDIEYKHIVKNSENYTDTLVNVTGTIIECTELETDYGIITYIHISTDYSDGDFCLYYLGQVDFFEDDEVYVFALPFDVTTFENMGGYYTQAVVGAASLVYPAGIS